MPAHKKPTVLKILHGSRKSTINQHEIHINQPAVCPDWLPQAAKDEWQRIWEGLGAVAPELITAADQAMFEALCVSYAMWRNAEEILAREGEVLRVPRLTRRGNFSGHFDLKKHPSAAVAKDRHAALMTLLNRFGLLPSTRHIVTAAEARMRTAALDEDDDFDAQLIGVPPSLPKP